MIDRRKNLDILLALYASESDMTAHHPFAVLIKHPSSSDLEFLVVKAENEEAAIVIAAQHNVENERGDAFLIAALGLPHMEKIIQAMRENHS